MAVKRMKQGVLWLCLAALLFLCACDPYSQLPKPMSVSEPVSQALLATASGENTELYMLSQGDKEYHYSLEAFVTIINRNGGVVMQGKNLRVLYDQATGLAQCIVAVKYESETGLLGVKDAKQFQALYDVQGNLLRDFETVSYGEGVGPYITAYASQSSNWFTQRGTENCLYNFKTGEQLYEGAYYIFGVKQNRWGVMGRDGLMGVLDDDGHEVIGFPLPGDFGWLTGWKEYYITTNDTKSVLLDESFNVVYSAGEDNHIQAMGDYLIINNWYEGTSYVLAMPRQEILLKTDDSWYIEYYNEEGAVLYDSNASNYYLCDTHGSILFGPCEWIGYNYRFPGQQGDTYLAQKDKTLYLLDIHGEVQGERPAKTVYTGQYCQDGNYILQYNDAELHTGELVGPNIETLIPKGKYTYINEVLHREQDVSGYYAAGRYQRDYMHEFIDVFDKEGELVLEDLREIQQSGPNRFVVVWGFDAGLIDAQGNWLYKVSAFAALEDE